MSKFNKEFHWMFGKGVNWIGYKRSGSYGMYCRQIRHHWFGLFGIIGLRYTISWGSDW